MSATMFPARWALLWTASLKLARSCFIREAHKDECGKPKQLAAVQAGEAAPPKEAEILDGPSEAAKGPN